MTVAAAGWWARHGTHTVLVLVPALMLGLVGLAADLRTWWQRDRSARPRPPAPLVVAAGLSAVGALVHVSVCPDHFREGLLYGAFFAVAAGCQLGWAVLVTTRYRRWLAAAGLLGNTAIVVLWVVTRTIGIPLGPEAGEVERFGVLDLLAGACEIGIVAMCAVVIRHHVHPWRTPRRNGFATRSSTV